MGMCIHQDITEESKKAKLQSSKIEQDLCEHAKTEMNVVKLLMLGKLKNIHVCGFFCFVFFIGFHYRISRFECESSGFCVRNRRKWQEHPDQTDEDHPQSWLLQTRAHQFQGIG